MIERVTESQKALAKERAAERRQGRPSRLGWLFRRGIFLILLIMAWGTASHLAGLPQQSSPYGVYLATKALIFQTSEVPGVRVPHLAVEHAQLGNMAGEHCMLAGYAEEGGSLEGHSLIEGVFVEVDGSTVYFNGWPHNRADIFEGLGPFENRLEPGQSRLVCNPLPIRLSWRLWESDYRFWQREWWNFL